MKIKHYRVGAELLDSNKRPIEHLGYAEDDDLSGAMMIYDSLTIDKNTAKYLIAVTDSDEEIELQSDGYKIDNNEDKYYYMYVLGYDLLHNTLNGIECDIAYDICEYVYDLFTQSEEFTDYSMCGYDALAKFIKNNETEIINYMRQYYFNGR